MKTSKKFAMMLMGSEYNTKKDYVVMQTESTETHIFTVNTPEQAVELAGQLAQQGFGLRSKRSCPTDFGVSRNFG